MQIKWSEANLPELNLCKLLASWLTLKTEAWNNVLALCANNQISGIKWVIYMTTQLIWLNCLDIFSDYCHLKFILYPPLKSPLVFSCNSNSSWYLSSERVSWQTEKTGPNYYSPDIKFKFQFPTQKKKIFIFNRWKKNHM